MSIPYIYPPDEFYWKKDLKKILRFFRDNLDSDFHIFHEANFHDPTDGRVRKADLLILTREGFLVIEAKANLQVEDRMYFQRCGCRFDKSCKKCKGKGRRYVDPFEQAESGLSGFLDLIFKNSHKGNINKVRKNYGVVSWGNLKEFAVSPLDISEKGGFLLTKRQLQEIKGDLKNKLKRLIYLGDGGERVFDTEEFENIINILSPLVQKEEYEEEFKALSTNEDEFIALVSYEYENVFEKDSFEYIEGTSGSGKTTLAKEVAKKHTLLNRSTCMIYRNLNIATQVRNEFSTQGVEVDVFGLHPFIFDTVRNYDVTGENVSIVLDVIATIKELGENLYNPSKEVFINNFSFTENEFFSNICIKALEEISQSEEFDKFDTIIIDEAQLFLPEQILAIKSLLSKDEPSMFLFADTFQFVNFGESEEVSWRPPDSGVKFRALPKLLRNYRTSNSVTKFMNNMAGTQLQMLDVEGQLYGPVKARSSEWVSKLEEAVEKLSEYFDPNEIVVLSPSRNFIETKFKELNQEKLFGTKFILDIRDKSYVDLDGILFSTVRRFTGRQSKAVILLLPDENVMREEIVINYPQLAFIGAGRAEHTLWVIHSPGVEKKLNFDNFSL